MGDLVVVESSLPHMSFSDQYPRVADKRSPQSFWDLDTQERVIGRDVRRVLALLSTILRQRANDTPRLCERLDYSARLELERDHGGDNVGRSRAQSMSRLSLYDLDFHHLSEELTPKRKSLSNGEVGCQRAKPDTKDAPRAWTTDSCPPKTLERNAIELARRRSWGCRMIS